MQGAWRAKRGRYRGAQLALWCAMVFSLATHTFAQPGPFLVNDSHFHLTNYIQEGIDIHDLLRLMGNKVGRVALFGIQLQTEWSYRVEGDRAATCSRHSEAPR